MVDTLWYPKIIVTIIHAVAIKIRPTCSNNILVEIIIWIAITIIKPSVIIRMIMPSEVYPSAYSRYTIPKSISLARIVIEAIVVEELKGRFVSKYKNVGR
jgi:hypothetical protein